MKANNDKNEINKPRKLLRGILIISKFLFERTRSTSSSNFTLQFSPRERREYPKAGTGEKFLFPGGGETKKWREKYVSQRRHLLFTAARAVHKYPRNPCYQRRGLAGGTISPPLAQLFQPALATTRVRYGVMDDALARQPSLRPTLPPSLLFLSLPSFLSPPPPSCVTPPLPREMPLE